MGKIGCYTIHKSLECAYSITDLASQDEGAHLSLSPLGGRAVVPLPVSTVIVSVPCTSSLNFVYLLYSAQVILVSPQELELRSFLPYHVDTSPSGNTVASRVP